MIPQPRLLLAISGGTCSGKSTLAATVSRQFLDQCVIVSVDDFYPDRERSPSSTLENMNWDSITSLDVPQFLTRVGALLSGESVCFPVYDRHSHHQCADARLVFPAPIVVVEGMHSVTLCEALIGQPNPYLGAQLSIFVECHEAERLNRRLARESELPTVDSDFTSYWEKQSVPTYRREIEPQRDRCNIVINSPMAPVEIDRLLELISSRIGIP